VIVQSENRVRFLAEGGIFLLTSVSRQVHCLITQTDNFTLPCRLQGNNGNDDNNYNSKSDMFISRLLNRTKSYLAIVITDGSVENLLVHVRIDIILGRN
jgi:hypothetical protein